MIRSSVSLDLRIVSASSATDSRFGRGISRGAGHRRHVSAPHRLDSLRDDRAVVGARAAGAAGPARGREAVLARRAAHAPSEARKALMAPPHPDLAFGGSRGPTGATVRLTPRRGRGLSTSARPIASTKAASGIGPACPALRRGAGEAAAARRSRWTPEHARLRTRQPRAAPELWRAKGTPLSSRSTFAPRAAAVTADSRAAMSSGSPRRARGTAPRSRPAVMRRSPPGAAPAPEASASTASPSSASSIPAPPSALDRPPKIPQRTLGRRAMSLLDRLTETGHDLTREQRLCSILRNEARHIAMRCARTANSSPSRNHGENR